VSKVETYTALLELAFPDNHFDFIHQRFMVMFIPTKSWGKVVREEFRVCRPGGLFNSIELDLRCPSAGPVYNQIIKWISEAMATNAISYAVLPQIGQILASAGFVDVKQERFSMTIGAHGSIARSSLESGLRAMQPSITQLNICTESQFEDAMKELAEELERIPVEVTLFTHSAYKPSAK
jgi:SAM-dependent methyltransferase